MTKYAEIDKVEAQLRAYADNVPEHFSDVIKGLIDAVVLDLIEAVKKIPAADVRENAKGIWKQMPKGWFRSRVVQCSKCGNTLDMNGVNAGRGDANFCPNCGADMRKPKGTEG